MKKLLLSMVLILCYSISSNGQVKNLDKLPKAKRDSILFETAKQTILKYGPDYYEEINNPPVNNHAPIIERKIAPAGGKNAGRVRFNVKFFCKKEFYDQFPDFKYVSYLAEVYIWEDTGLASDVMFEDRGLGGLDKLPKSRIANGKRVIIKKNSWIPVEVDDTTKTK